MGALLKVYWQIALLRQGPQSVPASSFLMWLVLAMHWFTGALLSVFTLPVAESLLAALAGTLILAAAVHTLLLLYRYHQRLVQTLTALAGCEIMLGLFALPPTGLFYVSESLRDIAAMFLLLLLGWNVAIAAHIFRHAVGTTMGKGLLFAIAYIWLSIYLGSFIGTPGG